MSCKQKYSLLVDLVFQVLISKSKFFKYKNQLLSYQRDAIDWMLDHIACLRGIHELVMRYA